MDKKYLKEHNLYEAHKQFMRLCEWSYVPQTLEEEGEDDAQQDPNSDMNGQDPNMGGDPNAMGGQNPNMDDPNAMAQDPNMGGQDPNSMPQDPNMVGDPNAMGGQDPNMDDPNAMGGEMPPMDDMGGEDETVIDVDDITNAQEKMNSKVNVVGKGLGEVDDKIESLLQSLSKMEAMIDNNNQEIAKFKAEFEKRNPTQTEKLNLRSLDSYPFNVNPKDYWAQKGADPNSNYSGYSNNEEPTTKEYVITNSDVDDFSEREMQDSFDIDDDLKQDINKIFGL